MPAGDRRDHTSPPPTATEPAARAPDREPAPPSILAPETQWVERLRRGDEQAYEQLVRAHGGRLLSVAQRYLPDPEDAREALQEAFLSAFRSISSFKGEAQISTWLHRILVNTALMKLRSRRRKPEEPIEELLPAFDESGHHVVAPTAWRPQAHERIARQETRALVRNAIQKLPDSYRTVLLLRDIDELDTETTASLLGISSNAVKIRLHRARQALRALLDPHFKAMTP